MEKNRELVVKARPFTKGSFEINIEVLIVGTAIATQLSPVTIFKIIQTLKEFFNVKNLLKGEVPIIEKNIIKNCNNYEISNNTIILLDRESESNRIISEAMFEIQKDEAIKALNIIDNSNRESIVKVKREEFSYYKIYEKESIEIEEQDIVTYDDQRLRIVSPVFDITDRRDWLFNWINNNDFRYSAKIEDEYFWEKVDSGESFSKGDIFVVKMTVINYSNKQISGRIIKVHQHIPKGKSKKNDFLF